MKMARSHFPRLGIGGIFPGVLLVLSGCASLPQSGPTTGKVTKAEGDDVAGATIAVVDVSAEVAGRLKLLSQTTPFAEIFGETAADEIRVGKGDTLDIAVWEAPPAVLFNTGAGSAIGGATGAGGISTSRSSELPQQVVDSRGRIEVPFAGTILADGRTTQEIAQDIRRRLRDMAHDPQVVVRIARNSTSNVTVIGDVANSTRLPLTPKGERLLDALASAGGVKQPVSKMTIQLTRGNRVDAMPLEAVIRDPRQNVRLKADDIVTLMFQPYSFTVLGAASKNEEVPFEGTGLTLSQAFGRMGGLQDQRANPRGVFIFRFEDPVTFGDAKGKVVNGDGKVPVIYRVDMKDPKTLFVAQSFPIKDKDVIYVSNAPLADFQKFLQAMSQIVYPIATIQNANVF